MHYNAKTKTLARSKSPFITFEHEDFLKHPLHCLIVHDPKIGQYEVYATLYPDNYRCVGMGASLEAACDNLLALMADVYRGVALLREYNIPGMTEQHRQFQRNEYAFMEGLFIPYTSKEFEAFIPEGWDDEDEFDEEGEGFSLN